MNVTKVDIRHLINKPDLKAIVSIILDNDIVIHDVRIIEAHGRLFLLYPNNHYKERKRGAVYPINREAQQKIETAVINEYQAATLRLVEKRKWFRFSNHCVYI